MSLSSFAFSSIEEDNDELLGLSSSFGFIPQLPMTMTG